MRTYLNLRWPRELTYVSTPDFVFLWGAIRENTFEVTGLLSISLSSLVTRFLRLRIERSCSQGCSNVFTDTFGFGPGNFSPRSSVFYIATRLVFEIIEFWSKKYF